MLAWAESHASMGGRRACLTPRRRAFDSKRGCHWPRPAELTGIGHAVSLVIVAVAERRPLPAGRLIVAAGDRLARFVAASVCRLLAAAMASRVAHVDGDASASTIGVIPHASAIAVLTAAASALPRPLATDRFIFIETACHPAAVPS